MRTTQLIFASLLLGSATLANAQAAAPVAAAPVAAQIKPGTTVFDTAGAEAAKIVSVTGNLVAVSTGTNTLSLPIASFANGPNGPVISVTKAQLDEAATKGAAEAAAAVKASLVTGASVRDVSGATVLGTIKTIADPNVVLATASGDVTVPVNAFAAAPSGLTIRMTSAQFASAAAAAKGTSAQ